MKTINFVNFSIVTMAALVVKSRFAGLKIEDDDSSPSEHIPKNNKIKATTEKKPEPLKKVKPNNIKVQVASLFLYEIIY